VRGAFSAKTKEELFDLGVLSELATSGRENAYHHWMRLNVV
jgi:hypothetical protein